MVAICIYAAVMAFSVHAKNKPITEQSQSYQQKWAEGKLGKQTAECMRLIRLAHKHNADPLWSVAIAINESGLDARKVSSRGARSSMQTYRRYSRCGGCDLRESGILIAKELEAKHGHCDGAAKYNAGPKGSCNGIGGAYAERAMLIYLKLFEFQKGL